MPSRLSEKGEFPIIIALIPGPHEPTMAVFEAVLNLILAEFAEHSCQPAGKVETPWRATEFAVNTETNVVEPAPVDLLLMLTSISCDRVALPKCMKCLGHSAILGCPFCDLNGITIRGARRFLGYSEEIECGFRFADARRYTRFAAAPGKTAGTHEGTYTHAERMELGRLVDQAAALAAVTGVAAPAKPEEWASHGTSAVVRALPYLTYSCFQISIWHALLYGVAKDFFNELFPTAADKKVADAARKKAEADAEAAGATPSSAPFSLAFTPEAKAVIKSRAARVQSSSDFNRAYRDVTSTTAATALRSGCTSPRPGASSCLRRCPMGARFSARPRSPRCGQTFARPSATMFEASTSTRRPRTRPPPGRRSPTRRTGASSRTPPRWSPRASRPCCWVTCTSSTSTRGSKRWIGGRWRQAASCGSSA